MDVKAAGFRPRKIKIGPDNLRDFFIDHLNRIYSAKVQLVQRLPEIAGLATFTDLRDAILETTEAVRKQIVRMEEIFEVMEIPVPVDYSSAIISLVTEGFTEVRERSDDPVLRDMSILFYMQNIEGVEMASFQVLQIAAVKLRNKLVKKLLKENFDEAKADRTLLLLVTTKYVVS